MAHKFNYNTVVLSEEEYEALLKDRVQLHEVKHKLERYVIDRMEFVLDGNSDLPVKNNLIKSLFDIFDL